jgi:hypothetical protein
MSAAVQRNRRFHVFVTRLVQVADAEKPRFVADVVLHDDADVGFEIGVSGHQIGRTSGGRKV